MEARFIADRGRVDHINGPCSFVVFHLVFASPTMRRQMQRFLSERPRMSGKSYLGPFTALDGCKGVCHYRVGAERQLIVEVVAESHAEAVECIEEMQGVFELWASIYESV